MLAGEGRKERAAAPHIQEGLREESKTKRVGVLGLFGRFTLLQFNVSWSYFTTYSLYLTLAASQSLLTGSYGRECGRWSHNATQEVWEDVNRPLSI